MTSTLRDVRALLDDVYPPATAESWDAVGLVGGDPGQEVRSALLAVDPVATVVDEAIDLGVDLLVVHHPLLLRGVHSIAADTAKGRVLHRLVRAGIALYTAHTNADAARGGVNDALAELMGLTRLRPLQQGEDDWGIGRVGELEASCTLRQLAERLAERLPATAQGIRVSGPADAEVTTVALCSGAGDSLFDAVRASAADVYVTADLRHHPASEAREHVGNGRPYLIDLSHWASEWPWLARCAEVLRPHLAVTISTRCTDPWTFRVPSPHRLQR